jgi:hypothetical protein
MLVVDLGDAGAELEAGLCDQPVALALVAQQAFVLDQQAQALIERQAFVSADLFALGLQGGGHAAELEFAQLGQGLDGHDVFLVVGFR